MGGRKKGNSAWGWCQRGSFYRKIQKTPNQKCLSSSGHLSVWIFLWHLFYSIFIYLFILAWGCLQGRSFQRITFDFLIFWDIQNRLHTWTHNLDSFYFAGGLHVYEYVQYTTGKSQTQPQSMILYGIMFIFFFLVCFYYITGQKVQAHSNYPEWNLLCNWHEKHFSFKVIFIDF